MFARRKVPLWYNSIKVNNNYNVYINNVLCCNVIHVHTDVYLTNMYLVKQCENSWIKYCSFQSCISANNHVLSKSNSFDTLASRHRYVKNCHVIKSKFQLTINAIDNAQISAHHFWHCKCSSILNFLLQISNK